MKALADASREVRVSAVENRRTLAGRGRPSAPARGDRARPTIRDWAVRQQRRGVDGGAAARAPRAVDRRECWSVTACDPVMTDARSADCAGLRARGARGCCCSVSERTPAREAAITMVAATIVKSAQQESAVGELFESTAETRRVRGGSARRCCAAPKWPSWAPRCRGRRRHARLVQAPLRRRVRPVPAGAPVRAAPTRSHARPTGRPRRLAPMRPPLRLTREPKPAGRPRRRQRRPRRARDRSARAGNVARQGGRRCRAARR